MFKIVHKGDFNHFEQFVNRVLKKDYLNIISGYANEGLEALRNMTPVDSGKTADSWRYEIVSEGGTTTVSYYNDNENMGENIAILLIYGHGLQDGGYVTGTDFVSPAIDPIFKNLANKMWEEVIE